MLSESLNSARVAARSSPHETVERTGRGILQRLALAEVACVRTMHVKAADRNAVLFTTIRRVRDTVSVWWKRARRRQMLAMLNDHGRRDICLTRCGVEREVRKPFWRACGRDHCVGTSPA